MCIPRYKGVGYSSGFCENMERVKASLKGNNYILVETCDDICKFCPNNRNGKCADDEKVAEYDRLVKEKLSKREIPLPKDICGDCCWFGICRNA